MWSADILDFAHRWRKNWRRLPTKQYQRRSARRVSRGKLTGLLAPRCPSICLLENVVLAKQIVDNVLLVLNVFLFALWVIVLYLLALHIPDWSLLPYFKEEIWLRGHGDFASWIFKNESHILVKVRFEQDFSCFFHSAYYEPPPQWSMLWQNSDLLEHAWDVNTACSYVIHCINLWYWESL